MSKQMSIGYFADGKWAHNAFELLIQDESISIKFICVRHDTQDLLLKEYAEKYNIDYIKHSNINCSDFLDRMKTYNCDLFVSMSFNQIFKKELFSLPKHKTINCHAGMLPFYRGRNVLNWALINDEKSFGITIHYVDEGIDTGDILLQEAFPIDDGDDYSTLLETAYVNCAKLLYHSIKTIQSGNHCVRKQVDIHPVGFYCGMRRLGDEKIDWSKSSRENFNFIRSICRPGPMARTTLNGKEVLINRAKMIDGAPPYIGIPGQIVGKTSDGIIVKTIDTVLEIVDCQYDGKIKLGDRFV